jgi:hypothetical protein
MVAADFTAGVRRSAVEVDSAGGVRFAEALVASRVARAWEVSVAALAQGDSMVDLAEDSTADLAEDLAGAFAEASAVVGAGAVGVGAGDLVGTLAGPTGDMDIPMDTTDTMWGRILTTTLTTMATATTRSMTGGITGAAMVAIAGMTMLRRRTIPTVHITTDNRPTIREDIGEDIGETLAGAIREVPRRTGFATRIACRRQELRMQRIPLRETSNELAPAITGSPILPARRAQNC